MTRAKLYIYIEVGPRDMYIDLAHTALGIFRFAAFFFFAQKNWLDDGNSTKMHNDNT